jgi:hypothetical protein
MHETRREFLRTMGTASSCFTLETIFPGQARYHPVPPPQPADPSEQETKGSPSAQDALALKRAQFAGNAKEFRKGVEKLYVLAGELKDEVSKTPTTSVFSLQMVKKTEEIEKLAKQLKTLAKG